MKSAASATNGIGFLQALTLIFIVLKLTGHIAWSWLWVLSPLWIPLGIALVCGAICLVLDNVGN